MALSKVDRAKYGPGTGEVVLGATLSLLLGVAVALVYLVTVPVETVKAPPKDLPAGKVVYYPGGRDVAKGQQWLRKRQLFTEGNSVSVSADELNLWMLSSASQPGSSPSAEGIISLGTPNFRILGNELQIGGDAMINVSWFSVQFPVVVQAIGRFEKQGDRFAFVPDECYVGSLPLQKVPLLGTLIYNYLLGRERIPADIAASWKKLAEVSIEDHTLKLTMR